jgi:NTP pyrophosphatase (non-canonical NTP hydrolase)
MSGAGPTQLRVRETMRQAGGYWRPLAAVARLLEELGELAELLPTGAIAGAGEPAPGPHERHALASELADLWIITAALADQFLAELPEPDTAPSAAGSLAALLAAAGPIGRVVNHYDGPKTPREAARLPSLGDAVRAFHAALAGLAGSEGVELAAAVSQKLDAIGASSDMQRFARDRSDPSTSPVLEALLHALAERPPQQPWPVRLWGAPPCPPGTPAELARWLAPSLRCFAKAAVPERLEGYVIAGEAQTAKQERTWNEELLDALDETGARARGSATVTLGGLRLEALLLPRPAGDGPPARRESYLLLARAGDG